MPDVNDRLNALEEYKTGHEAEIKVYWRTQWSTNKDIEERMRSVESFKNRLYGSVLVVAFVGAGVGSALVRLLAER